MQGFPIDLPPNSAGGDDGLDFRSKYETGLQRGIVEWLDPEPVRGDAQALRRGLPQRQGEHPIEHGETRGAPPDVRSEHDLRIGATSETDALAFKPAPQFGSVVYLAVVHERDATIFGLHRLMARCGQVDDA